MSSSEENYEWWDRGVCDGVQAAAFAAGAAFRIIDDTLDAGDTRRARMLLSLYQEWFSLERVPRRADGRFEATDLFLDHHYINAVRRRTRAARNPVGGEDDRSGGASESR